MSFYFRVTLLGHLLMFKSINPSSGLHTSFTKCNNNKNTVVFFSKLTFIYNFILLIAHQSKPLSFIFIVLFCIQTSAFFIFSLKKTHTKMYTHPLTRFMYKNISITRFPFHFHPSIHSSKSLISLLLLHFCAFFVYYQQL